MRRPSPRNLAQKMINEYMASAHMSRKEFANEKCHMSASWLLKILSGERPLTPLAAGIFQRATRGVLQAEALLTLAEQSAEGIE